jgi:cysteine-rich repeat protein
VLDEGEQCDDRNRLNGDGCDWLCRLGDGDPPPDPDPTVSSYVPDGDPMPVFVGRIFSNPYERLPLVWTGSEFATAYYEVPDEETSTIIFNKFSEVGEHLDADWTYTAPRNHFGLDLVWTGMGFGLFYNDAENRILYLPLNADGKPLGSPILVEPDPQARAPAADRTTDGFILAWVTEGSGGIGLSWCGCWSEPNDTIRVRKVGHGGETEGLPALIEDFAGGPPDIVTGEGGFGMTVPVNISPDWESCSFRFVLVSDDLSSTIQSGILGNGHSGDVVWSDGVYIVGWPHHDTMEGGDLEICFARFSTGGELERPPVCNLVTGYEENYPGASRLAAGDGGLALVNSVSSAQDLFFLRADSLGTAIAPVREVMEHSMPEPYGAYNIVWADMGFAILFTLGWGDGTTIYLQRFRPAD